MMADSSAFVHGICRKLRALDLSADYADFKTNVLAAKKAQKAQNKTRVGNFEDRILCFLRLLVADF